MNQESNVYKLSPRKESHASLVSGPKENYANTLKVSPRSTLNGRTVKLQPPPSIIRPPELSPSEETQFDPYEDEVKYRNMKIAEVLRQDYTPIDKRIREAWDKIDAMFDDNYVPTAASFSPLINAYALKGDKKGVELVIRRMKQNRIEMNEVIFTAWIKLYRIKRDVKNAKHIFYVVMPQHGITPSTPSYNSLFDLYGKLSLVNKVEELYEEMKKHNVERNIKTYTSILYAYVKQGNEEKAHKIIEEMQNDGIEPNAQACTCLLALYIRNRHVEPAEKIFAEMNEKFPLSVKILNTILYLYAVNCVNKEKAHEIMKRYTGDVQPDVKTYRIWLKMYEKENLTADELTNELRNSTGLKPNSKFYNVLVTFLAQKSQEEEVDLLVKKMEAEKINFDRCTLFSLIDLKVSKRKFMEANTIFEQMEIDERIKEENHRKIIDLHDLSHGAAYVKLRRFLCSPEVSTQPFTVITGKGLHSRKEKMFEMQRYIQKRLKENHPEFSIIKEEGKITIHPPLAKKREREKVKKATSIKKNDEPAKTRKVSNTAQQKLPKIKQTKKSRPITQRKVQTAPLSTGRLATGFIVLIFLHLACRHHFSGIAETAA